MIDETMEKARELLAAAWDIKEDRWGAAAFAAGHYCSVSSLTAVRGIAAAIEGGGWQDIATAPITPPNGRPAYWMLVVTENGRDVGIACREAGGSWTWDDGTPISSPRKWRPLPAAPRVEEVDRG